MFINDYSYKYHEADEISILKDYKRYIEEYKKFEKNKKEDDNGVYFHFVPYFLEQKFIEAQLRKNKIKDRQLKKLIHLIRIKSHKI